MSIILERAGTQGILTVEGDLTLSQAGDLRTGLIKALIDADEVGINFGAVTDVDLACLQLFCSAHRSAVRMNKRLFFTGAWPEKFKRTVNDAAYARLAGCRLDSNRSCLWTASSPCGVH